MSSAKQEHHTPEFEFIALVAVLTALTAMSIDTMLPGIGIMAKDLGALHDNDRQFIILGFFGGMTLGTLIFGPMSDSSGRRPAIFAGLAVYCLGAVLCMFAWNFPVLVIGRIIQGIGASSPRIVALAMVRDGAKGAAMARIMSFVMSVFMLVPILAPSIGQFVLDISNWRMIFTGFVVAAIAVGTWFGLRQEETLAQENRQPFDAANLWHGAVEVCTNRVAFGYTLASGAIFSVFTAYLGVCQQIFAEQYHQGTNFKYWFGGMATALALAMILNGKLVMRLGMRNLSKWALWGFVGVWVAMLAFCLIFAGQPPLLIIAVLFYFWFFCAGFTFGNFNALAMEPMGHIAGMAAAISGALSQGLAIVLGGFAGRFYDGTLTPLAMFFVVFGMLGMGFAAWAEAGRPLVKKSVA
jgi:MFS transporter, DHA1 family, multidrug resistance protein